jgi:hypothetical protein
LIPARKEQFSYLLKVLSIPASTEEISYLFEVLWLITARAEWISEQ